MALFGSGDTTKWWQRPFVSNFAGGPWALSAWFKNAGVTCYIAGYSDNNNTGQATSQVFGLNPYSSVLYIINRDTGGVQKYYSPAVPADSLWHHVLWYYNTDTDFGAWLDGVKLTSITSNGSPSPNGTSTLITVNAPWSGSAAPATQLVGEVVFWRDVMSQQDADALCKKGVNPLRVRRGTMQDYWPLRDSLRNLGPTRVGLTAVGAANVAKYGEHPPVELPPVRRRFYVVPSGNTLSGTLSFGPLSLQANLLESDSFSGTLDFALTATGTLTQADPFSGSLSFGPLTLSGSFLEADLFSAALDFGLGLAATLTQADPLAGTFDFGPLSAVSTLTQADPLTGAVTYGPLSASGLLAEVNSLAGSVTFGALSVQGALGSAQNFSSVLDFGPLGLLGNMLEADALSGTLDFGLSIRGTIVGAMFGTLDFPFTAAGTLTQTDALSGTLTFLELTSEGVITEQDNFIGTLTLAPPLLAGLLSARNPISGTITFDPSVHGAILEQDSMAGVLTLGGPSSVGAFVSTDPLGGVFTFGPFDLAAAMYSELRVPPALADIDASRFARVPLDSRTAGKIPFDDRTAR